MVELDGTGFTQYFAELGDDFGRKGDEVRGGSGGSGESDTEEAAEGVVFCESRLGDAVDGHGSVDTCELGGRLDVLRSGC